MPDRLLNAQRDYLVTVPAVKAELVTAQNLHAALNCERAGLPRT